MRRLFQTLNNLCASRFFPLVFIPVAILFLLLYSYTTSPLYLNDGFDSAVFKTMGLAILQGKVPYVDIFDHKGPILFFINALGQWLVSGRVGIFVLQCIGLSVALFYWYRTAKLFTNSLLSFLSVLVALFVFGAVIEEGNQCEEWMMYAFSVAIFYAANYFVNHCAENHPFSYSIVYGVCFGFTFFIRPNDAVAQLGGIMAGTTFYLIYRHRFKNAANNLLGFIGGFMVVAIPVLAYFACKHAVGDLYYGLIGFNQEYAGGLRSFAEALFSAKKRTLLLVFIALCAGLANTAHKNVLWIMIPTLSLVVMLLGSAFFLHYYIVAVPFFCVYIAAVCANKNLSVQILMIAILCLVPLFDQRTALQASRKAFSANVKVLLHGQQSIADFYTETDRLYSVIPDGDRQSVWNYNLKWRVGGQLEQSSFSSMWHNRLLQCNLVTFGRNQCLEEKDDLAVAKPQWVVLQSDTDIYKDTVLTSLYEPFATTDTSICKMELWHLKQ